MEIGFPEASENLELKQFCRFSANLIYRFRNCKSILLPVICLELYRTLWAKGRLSPFNWQRAYGIRIAGYGIRGSTGFRFVAGSQRTIVLLPAWYPRSMPALAHILRHFLSRYNHAAEPVLYKFSKCPA